MLTTLLGRPPFAAIGRGLLAATIVLTLGVASGPLATADEQDESKEPGATTFVGKLEGGPASARIAVVIQDKRCTAYVCSRDDEFNQKHAVWYRGQIDAQGRIQASASKARLSGERRGETLSLTVQSAQAEFSSTASLVQEDGAAGLYRDDTLIERKPWVSGWIIDAEGTVVGVSAKVDVDVDPEKAKKQLRTIATVGAAAAVNPALAPVVAAAKLAKRIRDKRVNPTRVNVVQVAGPGKGSNPAGKKEGIPAGKKEGQPKDAPPKGDQDFDVDEVQEGTLDIQTLAQQTFAQVANNTIKLGTADRGAFLTGLRVVGARAAAIRQQLAQGVGQATLLNLARTLDAQIRDLRDRAKALNNEQLKDALKDMRKKSEELVDDLD